MRYYSKRYPSQLFIRSNGKGFRFEATAGNKDIGLHATEDQALIKDFEIGIVKKIGGVAEITKQEYEELKKKEPSNKKSEALSPFKLALYKRAHDQGAADRAEAKRRQLTPVIESKTFDRAQGSKLNSGAGAYRPGTVKR